MDATDATALAAPQGANDSPFAIHDSRSEAPLRFAWQTEVSAPKPFRARAFHGETFTLACTPLQYAKPLAGLAGAAVALRWQTDGMDPDEWYEAPGEYDPATGTLSADWSPDCDTGADRVRFFLALETPGGASFRAFGTLDLAPSPGFTPAQRLPESQLDKLQDALKDETQARQQADNALETALQGHAKRCVPLLAPGEHADPDSHGKTALVTQNGTQGGFAVSGQAGAGPDAEAFVTKYQRDAITAFGANETEVERYLIGPQARNQNDAILRVGDLAGTKPVTVTPESVGYVQKVTLALQIDRETLAHAAAADAIDWVPSSKAVKAALDQKADKTHTHTTAQVTGLDAALAGKASAADLTAEATARAQADTAHTNALNAEATARQQGDADTLADAKAYADGKVAGVYHYKGSVASRTALPASPAVGDVYNVTDEDGQNVAWTGSAWDALGATVDLSAYSTTEQTDGRYLRLTGASSQTVNGTVIFNRINVNQLWSTGGAQFFQVVAAQGFRMLNIYELYAFGNVRFMQNAADGVHLYVKGIQEDGQALADKYAAKNHTHADVYTKAEVDAAIAQAVANAKTELLEQLKGLYAPLSSVQATVDGTTYRWAWDDTFQTFAMKQVTE